MFCFFVYRKPPALLVVPKSFSFAQFPPQRKAPLCKGSLPIRWGDVCEADRGGGTLVSQRSWLRGCTREKSEKTIPPSRQAVPPPFTQGRADYNNKCNTRKKYRQYSHQGVKCSYHTTFLNGGKNIVLHTFYTIWARKSTVFSKSRKKFSRNCKNYG